jgi:excisionase family DNA binding protein
MERQTLTVAEAAIFLGVSKDLIYHLVRQNRIPHIKVGNRVLFRKETLLIWMDNQEISVKGE